MTTVKNIITFLGITGCCLFSSCSAGGDTGAPTGPTSQTQYDTVSVLGDRAFERGLLRKRADMPSPGNIYPFGAATAAPIWEMAEWGTKYELEETDKTTDNDGRVTYANAGKAISFAKDGADVKVAMDIFTSTEYDAPRQQNQAWPHLLIEQSFPEKPLVKDLE